MKLVGILCLLVFAFSSVRCDDDGDDGKKLSTKLGYVVQSRRLCRPFPLKDFVCDIDYEISTALSPPVIERRGRIVAFRHRIYSRIFPMCPGCADSLKVLFCRQFFPKCLPRGVLAYPNKESESARVLAACQGCRVEQIVKSTLENATSGVVKNPYAYQCENEVKILRPCKRSKLYQVASAFIPDENVKDVLGEKYRKMRKQIPTRCRPMFRNFVICPKVYCGADYESLLMRVTSQNCIRLEKCVLRNKEIGAEDIVEYIRGVCNQYPDAESAEQRMVLKANGDGWNKEQETDD